MDRDVIERLVAMLDDLSDDEIAAFYFEMDAEAQYANGIRRRIATYIQQRMHVDEATEIRTDLWHMRQTPGRTEYVWDIAALEPLRELLPKGEWDELVTVETKHKVSKRKADALRKRGKAYAAAIDAAMTAVPGVPGLDVQPVGDPE